MSDENNASMGINPRTTFTTLKMKFQLTSSATRAVPTNASSDEFLSVMFRVCTPRSPGSKDYAAIAGVRPGHSRHASNIVNTCTVTMSVTTPGHPYAFHTGPGTADPMLPPMLYTIT
jgi:hypothetical protein